MNAYENYTTADKNLTKHFSLPVILVSNRFINKKYFANNLLCFF